MTTPSPEELANFTVTKGEPVEYHIKVGTCKDCKWWDIGDSPCQCDCPIRNSTVGGRNNIWVLYNDKKIPMGDYITLNTGPDFGCIHWEKKDD